MKRFHWQDNVLYDTQRNNTRIGHSLASACATNDSDNLAEALGDHFIENFEYAQSKVPDPLPAYGPENKPATVSPLLILGAAAVVVYLLGRD